ncbi:MAG: type I DNA topoisomerase [Defluviitaleaceae bacterium]|nr:type I DNA topoisomerase [Defluviitaleaceae bacterium]
MSKKLVIVESPAKAKTIENYLGKDYVVLSSVGHIRDLATTGPGGLGVDVENQFAANYKNATGKSKVIKELKHAAKNAEFVYLATDPDREGEAISWHLADVLEVDVDLKNRVVFNEITKNAVVDAFKAPRKIDMDLVRSQESRRIVDRIIGFKLSKLLQNKIKSKSAGRVQSVALRLIVEKEREIQAFISEEYWHIHGIFGAAHAQIEAELTKFEGKKLAIANEAEAMTHVHALAAPYVIDKIEKKNRKKSPKPPFITSTLQQEASSKLGFNARKTMSTAQKLYEGVSVGGEAVGLITYMRTDSTRLSDLFVGEAKDFIGQQYGETFVGKGTGAGKKSKNAQEAHEAIRPSSVMRTPESVKSHLKPDEFKLYKLIWERAVASLMADAMVEATSIDITSGAYNFRANGQILVFDGYLKVYSFENTKNEMLPTDLTEGMEVMNQSMTPTQHFTQPPARYSEARLIREMEELGIGRPSTYAQTMDTLKARGYVNLEERRFKPTEQGILTSDKLEEFFSNLINVEYTAKMEDDLDEIARGEKVWHVELKDFYDRFIPLVEHATENMEKIAPKEVGEDCPDCGHPLVVRRGRYGEFVACSNYPACTHIKKDATEGVTEDTGTGVTCPKCQEGEVVLKRSKRGRIFYGCNQYPKCDQAYWNKPIDQTCPHCKGLLVLKGKDEKITCPNKACDDKHEPVQA